MIMSAGALAAGVMMPHRVEAAQVFDLENLEEQIAAEVIRLKAGRDMTLSVLIPQGSFSNVDAVAKQFTMATGVDIEIVQTPLTDITTEILIENLGETGRFDVALPASYGVPDLVAANAVTNLDGLSARYAPADFDHGSLYTLSNFHAESLYGYLADGDVYMMFYNKRMLDDPDAQARFADMHGYPLGVPQTWQQLDEMMLFFHQPDIGQFGGLLFRGSAYVASEWWIRFHARGAWPFDDAMEPQIEGDAGLGALESLVAASQYMHPAAFSDDLFENWDGFGAGNVFCHIGWGGTRKYLNMTALGLSGDIVTAPTPGADINGQKIPFSYVNWGWNYAVPTHSKNTDIAYLFALYASGPKMSTTAIRKPDGFFDPFRIEHYDDPIITQIYSKQFLDAHLVSMQTAIPDLYLSGGGQYFDALREAIAASLSGQVTAETAMEICASQWRRVTRDAGRQKQIRQWRALRQRYPATMQSILK